MYRHRRSDTKVRIRVTGLVGRTHVVQLFRNPSEEWVEGVYVFPLPERAAVDTLRMKVGERVIEGQIQERAQARRTYEKAKREGKKASLLEQERPNIFTVSLAHIGPLEDVRIELEYQEEVRYEAGRFDLRFPMVVGPRYIPGIPTARTETVSFAGTGWAQPTRAVTDADRITPPLLPPTSRRENPVELDVELSLGMPLVSVESSLTRFEGGAPSRVPLPRDVDGRAGKGRCRQTGISPSAGRRMSAPPQGPRSSTKASAATTTCF